jgi:orotidine-5'-phosphate decarboxylase
MGATHESVGADLSFFAGSLLVPGIGPQGATMADVGRLFGDSSAVIVPTVSRQVLRAGPSSAGLRAAVDQLIGQLTQAQGPLSTG